MKHKAKRVDNLMYKGCEPHWKCIYCGKAVPFHCYSKEQLENMCCGCNKINCNDCDKATSDCKETEGANNEKTDR